MTEAELAARLVKAGFMPTLVETALQAADAAGQAAPTEADSAQDAIVTDADIALAQTFWWYTPDVPQTYKRLLTARQRHATPR